MSEAVVAAERLKALIERIEKLEDEKKGVSEDISDIYKEAKGEGFDTKAMKTVIKLRQISRDERKHQEALLETYMKALGID